MHAVWFRIRCAWTATWAAQVSLMAVVTVAVGAVLVVSAGAARTITAPDRYEAALAFDTDVMVEQQDLGAPKSTELNALRSVAQVRSMTFLFAALIPEGGGDPVESLVFAGSYEPFGARLVTGRAPETAAEIVVSSRFIERTGARLGDRYLVFAIPSAQAAEVGFAGPFPDAPAATVRVVGVYAAATELQFDYATALLAPEVLSSDLDVGVASTLHGVELASGATTADLRRELDQLSDTTFGIEPAEVVPSSVRDAVTARGLAIAVVSVILALATVVVVGQLLARQYRLDDNERSPLQAMGMTTAQLLMDQVGRAAVPLSSGAALGAAAAVAASGRFPLGFVARIEPDPGIRFEPAVHLGVALGLIVLVVSWIVVSLQARAAAPSTSPGPVVEELARRLPSAAAGVGLRFASSPPPGDRTAPNRGVLGSAMVAAGVVAALVLGATADSFLVDRRGRGDADLTIGQGGDALDESVVATLSEEPLVEEVAVAGTALVSVGPEALDIVALQPRRSAIVPDVLEGRLPVAEDELALGRVSARQLGVEVGDDLTVTITGDDGPVQRRLVVTGVAVIPSVNSVDGLGHGGLVTPDGLGALDPHVAFATVLINVVAGADPDAVAALGERVGGGPADPNATVVTMERVKGFPTAVAVTLAALAVANLLHLLIRSARRRRRDLAILRALGAAPSWVAAALHWQLTAMATVVVAVATPLGLVVGRASAGWYLNRIGAATEVAVDVPQLLVGIVGLLVLANLAAVVPAASARRASVALLLAQE